MPILLIRNEETEEIEFVFERARLFGMRNKYRFDEGCMTIPSSERGVAAVQHGSEVGMFSA